MFSLHERKQRLICRVLFVLLAAVPAIGTLAFIAYSLRPWAEQDWQESLSHQLHAQVSVAEVRTPRPGVQELTSVQIADLRTQKPLAEIDKLRLTCQRDRLSLSIDKLEVQQAELTLLATALSTSLTASDLPPALIEARHVLIHGKNQKPLELAKTRMHLGSGDVRVLKIESELVDPVSSAHMPQLHLDIGRQGTTTIARLDTGGTQLPAWILSDLWPSLKACDEATFAGRIELAGSPTTSQGSLHGRIDNVCFEQWLGRHSPHTLAGTGELVLDGFRWQDRRIEVAHGTLSATGGSASFSLLGDLQRLLHCQLGPAVASVANNQPEQLIEFDELSLAFHLTASGLTLTGRCQSISDGTPGCMLVRRGEAVLREPIYPNLHLGNFVQVFAHTHPDVSWLPATVEAHDMAGSLPLPRVGPQPEPDPPAVASQPKDSTSR